jgi:hypothetical protein
MENISKEQIYCIIAIFIFQIVLQAILGCHKSMEEHLEKSQHKEKSMSITSGEFQGLARSMKGKGKNKTSAPTVKVPKMSKEEKAKLVPFGNSPQRRANTANM